MTKKITMKNRLKKIQSLSDVDINVQCNDEEIQGPYDVKMDILSHEEDDKQVEMVEIGEQAQDKIYIFGEVLESTLCSEDTKQNKIKSTFSHLSNIANLIGKVIGESRILVQFDKHHIKYRDTGNRYSKQQCANLFLKLQSKVLKKYSTSKTMVQSWEKNFFLKNNHEPTNEDISKDGEAKKLFRQMMLAKKLLQMWKL